jgi:hypothetical protein
MLQNRIYRGEIVHNKQSYFGEHQPLIPETEWFRNIRNPTTERAYENAIRDCPGGRIPHRTRAHVIAWARRPRRPHP